MSPLLRAALFASLAACSLLAGVDGLSGDPSSDPALEGGADVVAGDGPSREDGAESTDAGVSDGGDAGDAVSDAPFDAQPACDRDAPFGLLLTVQIGLGAADVAGMVLSPDELTGYFQARFDGGGYDLYSATRPDRSAAFGSPTPLSALNAPVANDTNITVSRDELTAIFASDRLSDAGVTDLFVTTRNISSGGFASPTRITTLAVAGPLNTPFLTADGSELWLSVLGGAGRTTYVSASTLGFFLAAKARPDVLGGAPVLSADRLTVYSAQGTSSLTNTIHVAHRPTVLDTFSMDAPLTGVNSGMGDTPSWLSPDRCRLYFTTRRNGPAEIFVAERFPL